MTKSKVLIEEDILDSDYDLIGLHIEGVEIINSRFHGNFTIVDCNISQPFIGNDIKIKGNIIFKNCVFNDKIIISKLNCLGSFDFIDCHLQKSFNIHSTKVKKHFSFLYCTISNDLLLNDLSTIDLSVEDTKVKNLTINSKHASAIENIHVKNSSIENKLDLSELHETSYLWLNNCNVGFLLIIHKIYSQKTLTLKISNSYTKYLKIHNIKTTMNLSVNIIECITEKNQITHLESIFGIIDFNNTNTTGITKFSKIDTNLKVDISSLATAELIIDASFYENISSNYLSSQLLLDNRNQQIATIKILVNFFHQKGNIRLQDKMTFILKGIEFLNKSNTSGIKNVLLTIRYFLGKYVFGWGVKLSQLFISFLFVTILFAFLYLVLMNSCGDFSFFFKNIKYSGFIAPFELSLLYMLGFYSEVEVNCINYIVGLIQHIIGIAYITLIIGVGIRKLVN